MKNIIPKLEVISKDNSNMGLLAKYLLEYNGDIAELKISKICEDLYISVASATRLAKMLGLDGFSQLKIYLAQELVTNEVSSHKYANISAKKYYHDIIQSLSTTLNDVNDELLIAVSQEIENSRKINFFAVGGSHTVITDFAQKLARIKFDVTYHSDTHFQFVEAVNSEDDQLSIGLSYSGLTHEVLANLQLSKNNGAKTVLITNNKNIEYPFLDYVIELSSSDNSMRTYSISSRFSSLAILDLLYLNVIGARPQYYNDLLERNRYIK
ncbi:MurR/RpiR family transcriptional regulator [Mollicutes bacterium LVI A0039]|nr:MurR/RpiR family transcriptional regulator [Mollicutes bacterium LVI A0039]